MIVCPRCGSPVKPSDAHCGVCGATLEGAPKEDRAQHPSAPPSASMKKTMMGMAPNASPPAPAPQKSSPLKGTMLGMPAAPVPVGVPAGAAAARAAGGGPAGKQTLVGVASPVAAAPSAPPPPGRRPMDHKKTMLGVAMPGIAPLAPGVPKEPPRELIPTGGPRTRVDALVPPPAGQVLPGQPGVQPASQLQSSDGHRSRSSRPPDDPGKSPAGGKPRPQYSATVALVSGLVLATGAAAFAFFWRSPPPLRAEARVDGNGTDLLHVTCQTCPDDTELRIGETKAKVTGQVADLPLATPLAVGENRFTVHVDRPANGRDEKVALIVKIGYRIRPDLSGLEEGRPVLRILVDGAPLAKMVIDGKPLDLGPDGKGKYEIDVTADCTGLADESKTLERSVSYSVVGTTGAPEQGAVGLRVAVTPLRTDVPTEHAVVDTERFLLAGRTGRGAKVVAGGEAVGVGADGTFSKLVASPLLGDNLVWLRATVSGLAPRIASVRVKRVVKLADEAHDFAASAPLAFSDLAADVGKHVGEPVVLVGDIVEARQQGARNLALLDVQKGCLRPPCVARVVLASGDAIARGDKLQVFGHVTRAVGAKGEAASAVPEVEGDFFLRRH